MAKGIPYPQWEYPGHELHQLQWQLTRLALELVKTVSHETHWLCRSTSSAG